MIYPQIWRRHIQSDDGHNNCSMATNAVNRNSMSDYLFDKACFVFSRRRARNIMPVITDKTWCLVDTPHVRNPDTKICKIMIKRKMCTFVFCRRLSKRVLLTFTHARYDRPVFFKKKKIIKILEIVQPKHETPKANERQVDELSFS